MPSARVEVSKFTGADYEYDYRQINRLSETAIARYSGSLRQRLANIPDTTGAAEEWVVRTYIALKYVLASSLMLSSARFAAERNLRIVEPYLLYYSVFNCSRAFFLMIPEQGWKDGAIIRDTTHKKVNNVVADYLRYLSKDVSDRYTTVYGGALAARELFSYRFPAEGLRGFAGKILPALDDVIEVCQWLADAAQLHSECVQTAFAAVPDGKLSPNSRSLRHFFKYEHRALSQPAADHEDWYRLWQFGRHANRPWSLHLTARAGLVDDFFGAWCPPDDSSATAEPYDPDDTDVRIIFDFP